MNEYEWTVRYDRDFTASVTVYTGVMYVGLSGALAHTYARMRLDIETATRRWDAEAPRFMRWWQLVE